MHYLNYQLPGFHRSRSAPKLCTQAKVLPYEDRKQSTNLNTHPYFSIGQIYCDDQYGSGTGTMIHRRVVITAAHVITRNKFLTVQHLNGKVQWDSIKSQIAKKIQFRLANSSNKILVKDYWIDERYFSTFQYEQKYDIAVLILQEGATVDSARALRMNFAYKFQKIIKVAGYPQDKQTLHQSQRRADKVENGLLFYKHGTRPGNSGGPVLMKVSLDRYELVAVHRGTNFEYNYGVLLASLRSSSQSISKFIQSISDQIVRLSMKNIFRHVYQATFKSKYIEQNIQKQNLLRQNSSLKQQKIQLERQKWSLYYKNITLDKKIHDLQQRIQTLQEQHAQLYKQTKDQSVSTIDLNCKQQIQIIADKDLKELLTEKQTQIQLIQDQLLRNQCIKVMKTAQNIINENRIKRYLENLLKNDKQQSEGSCPQNRIDGFQKSIQNMWKKPNTTLFGNHTFHQNGSQISIRNFYNKPIKFSMNDFVDVASFRHVQVLVLYEVPINDDDWRIFVQKSNNFCNLVVLVLSFYRRKGITSIKQSDLQKFKMLQQFRFRRNSLTSQSINQLQNYQKKHPTVKLKYSSLL